MLPGRCSLELSDRKLHRKIKSHKLRAKQTDLPFYGPFLEMQRRDLGFFLSVSRTPSFSGMLRQCKSNVHTA
ncbi:MAG: hypothetical protein QOH35_431 [Acidobacteriaceae bacterium]|nr:hypothetical protein [Acidobacteriaceae bacterium]